MRSSTTGLESTCPSSSGGSAGVNLSSGIAGVLLEDSGCKDALDVSTVSRDRDLRRLVLPPAAEGDV